jgi:hypothetical protein
MAEATARFAVRLDAPSLQVLTAGDVECIICLAEMEPEEALVQLPCSEGDKAHVFHEQCLGRWLLTSAACPTCRRGVRPMLKQHEHEPQAQRQRHGQHLQRQEQLGLGVGRRHGFVP